MTRRKKLKGRFQRINTAHLKHRAGRTSDPRHIFYRAMLETDSYERYMAETHGKDAWTHDRVQDGTDGRAEILYARRNGWIVDVPGE